jgi:predicted metal-dependent enzyme (double-stranded beta helix superfamily)
MDLCQTAVWWPCRTAGIVKCVITRTLTPAVAALATEITTVVRRAATPIDTGHDVAAALATVLGDPDLLADGDKQASRDCYRQHVLYVDPDSAFSIVALVWLPGQFTAIHDHISWCVVGVHEGDEEETLYRLSADETYLMPAGHSVNGQGTTSFFAPPGDIHAVRNSSARKVISIHVYGADIALLGSSVRRRYHLPVRER